MSNDLLKYLSDKIQEERGIITEDTALGKAKDFGDYKYACGIVRGLLIANNLIIETAQRMETDND
ncbi:hypothetical protein UFOVP1288_69 [uncultured Caudovirales phage]|uniref:Uncharacterized protein n=1 Tax=uncultured Caudovirales phage TaxID=2100421 RepID=A0A6J5RVD8_9CAUD|nr:hypothetical protein UFOVP1195_69 [uncultured Caudovirales phage]CAB4196235.1 hypothetical protein UFOVP1288_69 [uncultured Caudovirales phage]CAB4205187.1 hypothetical protein UFOVP1409_69 [uncultured Caudovirales phage]